MSDPRDPMTPIHPQMPHSSSGGVIKKVGLAVMGLLLIVVVTVVSVTQLHGSHTTHHTVAPTSSPSSPSATSSAQGGDVADRPNGCAGGTDMPNAISAAFSEPITTKGAVEFTATMMRWLWSSDVDNTQMTSVGPRLASPKIINHFTQTKAKLPTGSTMAFSTKTSAAWVKSFDAAKGTAQVYFAGQGTATTTSTATVDSRAVVDLMVKDGHWFMASSGSGGLGSNDSAFETINSQIAIHGGSLSGGC